MSSERHKGDNGIKHSLRSGIKIAADEKLPVAQQAHGNEKGSNCKRDNSNVNTKIPPNTPKSPTAQKTHPTCSEKLSVTKSNSEKNNEIQKSSPEKGISLRRSPRRKTVQLSDKSCEKYHNQDAIPYTKTSKKGPKAGSKRNVRENQASACTSLNNEGLFTLQGRQNPSEKSHLYPRRLSSPTQPTKSMSSSTKRASLSPDKFHTPRSSRRNSFPSIQRRTSPRRKSPVKYYYGSIRSPKQKSKLRTIRKTSLSPGNSVTFDRYNKGIEQRSACLPSDETISNKNTTRTDVRAQSSMSSNKCQLPLVKKEKESEMKTNDILDCSFGHTRSRLSSMSPQKAGISATERELKKIKDYWSPKQTETNTARVLRNGRSVDASVSPGIKNIRIKQEPGNEIENIDQTKNIGQATSARREIHFDQTENSVVKRKYESTTADEDDGDSHPIPRRKKLRSEVKTDELWEGLQIQRFKRLTPKKEKIDTQAPLNHFSGNVTNTVQCGVSGNNDMCSGNTESQSHNTMSCHEEISDFDFSNVVVKKERYDDEYEEDCYGLDKTEETCESQRENVTYVTKSILEKSSEQDFVVVNNSNVENISSYFSDQYHILKLESEDTSSYTNASANEDGKSPISIPPPTSPQKLEDMRQHTEISDSEDMYRLDGEDFQFEGETSAESRHSNTSKCRGMLDLECDTSISQTIESERDLEDTFLYYDMPSPSELERSQPDLRFHEYNDPHDLIKERIPETSQLKNQTESLQTDSNVEYGIHVNLEVREFDDESTETNAVPETELQAASDLNADVHSYHESDSVSSEIHLEIKGDSVREGNSVVDVIGDDLYTSTEGSTESKEITDSSGDEMDVCLDTRPEKVTEIKELGADRITMEEGIKNSDINSQDELTEENEEDRQKLEFLEDTAASKVCEQKGGSLTDCDGPSSINTIITPLKNSRRQIIESTTPKRSARLQERRGNTPSKWEEEYVFTPLRRVDESKKVPREQKSVTSTKSDMNFGQDDDSPQFHGENLRSFSSHDIDSTANQVEEICLDLSPKRQNSSTKMSHSTGHSLTPRRSDETLSGKNQSVFSDEHPPLKIRVKKSADGTTRIVASPSSKSAILNMCPGNPELVLTPCDKKQKKKDVPMRSLLKHSFMLKKSSSSPSASKRKRSRPQEEGPVEQDDQEDDKLADKKNKRKKEGAHTYIGSDTERRHHNHASTKSERIPTERAGKRRLDDTDDLLKNVMVGKHASILWLSENRRHFLLKHAESTPSEIDAMLSDAWKNLGEKEKLKYYQRANGAMRDENKHSSLKPRQRQPEKKNKFSLKEEGKMSKKMLRFLSLSPMEQHEELRRWLRFFVYEVSPAEYAKLIADFKETMKDLKENQQQVSDLEMQALYRKVLFQKILDLQDKIVDIYHQKREKQDEIVKEGFDILTKRLIIGDAIPFSNTVRSDDLQQVLLDLKLLENERKVAVSGTPLKSKSYENVLEQLQECEHIAESETSCVESCSSAKLSTTSELPEADSRFANELLFGIKQKTLPQFEVFNLEQDLDNGRDEDLPNEDLDEKNTKEIFAKLSKFFEQEAVLNNDVNFWAPGLSPGRNVSVPSSVLTDCLLADQFKMLAKNPSVLSSGVKMLIDPSQLKPFLQGKNVHGFRSAPRIVQYPSPLLRYTPSSLDKNQNGHTKRRAATSKYDKYKTHSLTGHSPVTVHYAGRPRYPSSHCLPRMSHLSHIPPQPLPQTNWCPPSTQSAVLHRPRIVVKEPDSRYTSIIHRRIQNVEGGTVVQYTASSLGRRPSS